SDFFWVDVLAFAEIGDDVSDIARVIVVGRRFRPAAALARAALVVADGHEARVGQRRGELREDRNTGRNFVAIGGTRGRDQDDGGKAAFGGGGRPRHGCGEAEAI